MAVCCEPAVAVMFLDVFLSDAAQSHRLATSTRDIVVRRNISCTGLHVKTSHVPALQVMQRFQLMHLRPRALHRSRLMDLRPGHCAAPGSCASVPNAASPPVLHQHPSAAPIPARAPASQRCTVPGSRTCVPGATSSWTQEAEARATHAKTRTAPKGSPRFCG